MADLATLRVSVDSREVKAATTDLNALGAAAGNTEQRANGLGRAFGALSGVLAGIGFGLLAREAILMADTMTRMSGQLALVTNNAQQLASAEKQLFALSQNTRVGYESTVSLFTRLARSTENLGVSQQSVMRVTETINKAMIVSGSSAEQASGALMQLGQAFASGALRGDELNSVMEGMPRVAQAIAEGMGITVGELRKLGAQGKLTGAEVYAALLKMGNDIDNEFKRMPMTVAQSMTVLNNSLMLFIAEADRATGFTEALAAGIVSLSNNLNQIARVAQIVIVAAAGMAAAFVAFRAALAIQAVAAYIGQLIALQFALGATTTASALAGAGIKGLQAILASTGWGLAVVAIGAVVGAIYALVTAQSEARGETQNLINDLGRLAATQDKNYAQAAKRGFAGLKDVQTERNILIERNKQIEAYTAKSGMVGKVAIEYKKNATAIKEANTFLIQNGNAIIESNKVYSQTEPVLQNASAAIEKTGKKAKEATGSLDKYRNALADIVEEGIKIGMTPEQIKAFDVEKLALAAAGEGYLDYAKKIRDAGAATAEKQAQFNAQEIANGYKLEAEAVGKTSLELKQLEINQKAATVAAGPLRDEIIASGNALIANMKALEAKKEADEKAKIATDEFKKALEAFNNLNIDINFDAIFGNMGKAMGGVVSAFDRILDRQEKYNELVKLGFKDEKTRAAAQQRNSRLEINQYANLAGAAKGFFKEKSTGYKVMQAAETAFRAVEMALALKSMAMKAKETVVSIANGAAKMFSQLGVWAFPVVAAMIGVMVGLGASGGSVSEPTIPDAEAMQATQGTGSVLGDSTAKSDSINRALEIMAANSNSNLEYSNQMLASLRSIQNSMADLANNVAKQISVSGSMFDTSGQRLGSSGSGGFLGIGKTSTTRELQDLGIDIVSTTIADIIAGGISGSTYQVVQQVKKKSGFLGIGGGTKTTYQTTTGNIDQDVRDSITGVIASLRQGLIDGANVIGLDGAQAILDSFQVNIGKISLAGLSGSEIEEQLNAVFSKVGDEMAGALFPALTGMQRIGEGLFETFARVAREYQVVDVALASIGKEFGAVGVSSLAARSALVQMFESLDQFVEQTNFFRDNFLTEAERIAPVTQAVAAELERLGLASITTIDQFKNAVLGLDLTSASGQETYAALLQLAPAFKMVADYQAEIAKLQVASAEAGIDTAKINAENAKAALEIQQKRVSMEIQLLEAQGFASEALAIRRRLELAAMDESLRALQEQIYAAQDAATAARDAKAASDAAARDAAQQVNLEIQLMEAQGNAAGALAARRQLELAAMNETLGALQAQIYAAQDLQASIEAASRAAQQAADQAAGIARERTNLEIQLMEEQGDAAGALAARRALELAALDESNRAIQEQIYIQQDANNRAAELAAAREAAQQRAEAARAKAEQELEARLAAAAQLANDRRQLEIQLMELQGKTSEALAARRAIELAGMDATLRGLQQRIYAEEDAAKRADAAATLASDRRSLEIELMEALGNSTGALAATRALELAGLDASLRGLQLQIYAANDAREASLAAAEAAAAAAEEQERLAEEAFALAQNRRSLEIELLDAQGFAVEALALRRAMELEAMDASLRGIQMQIWAALAQAEANELAAQVAQDAAEAQAKAAEDAAKALQDYSDALANVSQTVIDEINRLRGISATSSSSLLKAQFATLTAQARTGNLDALGKLPELSRSIEEATLGTATSALEVARIRAWLAASLSETLALQGASDSMVNATSSGLTFDGNNTASANAEQTSGELSNMSNVLYNALYQVAKNTGKSYELMDRWDGDGLPDIREDASDYY